MFDSRKRSCHEKWDLCLGKLEDTYDVRVQCWQRLHRVKPSCAPLSEPRSYRLPLAVTSLLPAWTRQCWNTCRQRLTSFHPLCPPLCHCCTVSLLLGLPPFPFGAAPASSPDAEPSAVGCASSCVCSEREGSTCSLFPLAPSWLWEPPWAAARACLPSPCPCSCREARPGQGTGLGRTHRGGHWRAALRGRNPGLALAPGGTKHPHSAVECP